MGLDALKPQIKKKTSERAYYVENRRSQYDKNFHHTLERYLLTAPLILLATSRNREKLLNLSNSSLEFLVPTTYYVNKGDLGLYPCAGPYSPLGRNPYQSWPYK